MSPMTSPEETRRAIRPVIGETLHHAWIEGGSLLPALSDASVAVLRAESVEAVFAAMAAAIARGTGARRCFLWVKDPACPDVFLGTRIPTETGGAFGPWRPAVDDRACWDACRRALATGRPVEALDGAPARRSVLALPLATSGEALGVLYVEADLPAHRLTEADLAWCQALAPVTAAALEIGRLHEARERQAHELAETLEKYRTAQHEASTDALTGLANRRCFLDHCDRQTAIASRYGAPYALLLIDVDHFKACNDIYGHAAGDLMLRTVGATLTRSIRQPDLAARYGGEEFVILCPNTDARKAALLAERVRRAIAAARPQAEGFDLPPGVTASIGVATYQAADTHVAAVIDRADRALYQAKHEGRNRVVLAD